MSVRSNQELEIWKRWQKSGFTDQISFMELYRSLEPLAQSVVNKWSGSGIPTSVIEAEVKQLMIDALPKFDPSMNIQLNTFLINQLKKVSRMIYKYQNIGTIPEQRAIKIDQFKKVKTFLADKFNREPNATEMADELTWPLVEVERMEKELKASVQLSEELSMMSVELPTRTQEVVDFIYYELDPDEKLVYEYLLGKNGKSKLSGQEIADKMGVSPSTITRLRQSIEQKINKYQGLL